jgi:heptosyltransferase-2
MMETLIVKLGATGDVVRTTPVLRRLEGHVTWVTASKNRTLLENLGALPVDLHVISWEERSILDGKPYDLVVHLEDDFETAAIQKLVRTGRVFGSYIDNNGRMAYTEDSSQWFNLSLISVHGRKKADELKLQNRRTYQELIFEGLGLGFEGEKYLLPPTTKSCLNGDVAIASGAGPVWPMKKWEYFAWLKSELESRGFAVNFLPKRPTLLEHLSDVRGHRCLVSGDSLPMHLALGSNIPCVGLFNCTSPWEIYDYGILTKLISPQLDEFFYKREFDPRATTAITKDLVLTSVLHALGTT